MVQGPTMFDRLDGVNEGIADKAPCRVKTTTNITLSGLQSIDGVTVAADDRVLVANQTDATQNGVYNASSGAWTRALDFDGNRDIVHGTKVFIHSGSVNGATMWYVTTSDPITIDEDAIHFSIWSGGAGFPNASYVTVDDEGASLPNSRQIEAGTGITIVDLGGGQTLTISVTANVRTATAIFVFDGGGSALTTGIKGDIQIHLAGAIQSWTLLADQSGSIVVDVWKDTYANYPPTGADTITASEKPTISAAAKATGNCTGWTTAVAAGDCFRFNIDSVSTITRCTLALKILKS